MAENAMVPTNMAAPTSALVAEANRFQAIDFLNKAQMDSLVSVADRISKAGGIPDAYKGKGPDVFVALIKSYNLGVNVFSLMENTFIVHGKIGYEAKFVIGMINMSGVFEDDVDWDIKGATRETMSVIAYAKIKKNGKTVKSPPITLAYVKSMGWYDKPGSQWPTNFEMMARYRSASMLSKLYCPQVLMGIQMADEIRDAEFTVVDDKDPPKPGLLDMPVVQTTQELAQQLAAAPTITASPVSSSVVVPAAATAAVQVPVDQSPGPVLASQAEEPAKTDEGPDPFAPNPEPVQETTPAPVQKEPKTDPAPAPTPTAPKAAEPTKKAVNPMADSLPVVRQYLREQMGPATIKDMETLYISKKVLKPGETIDNLEDSRLRYAAANIERTKAAVAKNKAEKK